MKWIQRGIILLAVGGFAAAVFTVFCNALFRCGCQGVWAAGSSLCNVHTTGVAHCPFCSTGQWGAILPRALIWTTQAAVVLVPARLSAVSRLLLGILVFVAAGAAAGFFFRWWTGYPTFLRI